MKKIMCVLVCMIFLSIAVTVPATSIKITKPKLDNNDIKYLDLFVYREENEELIPVHRAEVYVYVYPKIVPQFGLTYTDGHLLFEPTVRIGDDVKIVAKHEWFGANITFINIDEQDPEVIPIDLTLDPEKTLSKNKLELTRLPFFMQKLQILISKILLKS